MAEAAVRAAIDRALQIDDAEERVLGTLHNATRDHVEQFRRSTNSWIAISQGEVTAFISTKAQESACIFPVEIVTLRAHPTASVWAGTEEVHSASPYGGFDDWRARYLYILKIEGQSDGNSAESLSRSGSRRSELECWQKFESAVGDIGARVQELRFDDARHLVSMIWEGLPHQVLFKSRLRELKAILIDEIDKAEYDSVRHFSEDVMKNVTALVQDGKFDQARGLLSKRRAVSRHLSQEVKKVLEGISRAEADWEGCRREAIVLQEVLIRIGTRNP